MPKITPSRQKTFQRFKTRPKKKRFTWQIVLGLIAFLVVTVGSVAGFYLSQTTQDNRQQASVGAACGTSGGVCKLGVCGSGFETTPGSCTAGSDEVCCKPRLVASPTPAPTPNCPVNSVWVASQLACRCSNGIFVPPSGSCPILALNCPGGTTIVNNQCICNVSGAIVASNGSCVAKSCPPNSFAILTGDSIGACKCAGGPITLPSGTCPLSTCQARGNICQPNGDCTNGYERAYDGQCTQSGDACCKPKLTCLTNNAVNTCNTKACPLSKIPAHGTCKSGSVCCKPLPNLTCQQRSPKNICQGGDVCRTGFTRTGGECGRGFTCCKPKP